VRAQIVVDKSDDFVLIRHVALPEKNDMPAKRPEQHTVPG
jgi:hypothetical protein